MLSRRLQLLCAHTGYAFVFVFLIAFWLLAEFIPPPDPSAGPEEIAERFRDNTTGIRLGMVVGIFVSALLLPWGGAIAVQMKRIEGRFSPLVYAQIAAAALLVVEFIYPCAWWGLAAFRPTDDPEIIQRLNDLAWLAFLGIVSTAMVQAFMLGILTLTDKRADPVYPRWFGYFNLWCGTLFVPAGLIFFFKDGPFAWNGLMAWWVALTVFSAWMLVVTAMTARAIRRQSDEEGQTPVDEHDQLAALRSELADLRAQVAGLEARS